MKRRKFLLSGSLLSTAAFGSPIPNGDNLHFRVFRNGSPIGDQYLNFSQSGANLTVRITGSLLVKMAMIPIFRYNLDATEYWENGVFPKCREFGEFQRRAIAGLCAQNPHGLSGARNPRAALYGPAGYAASYLLEQNPCWTARF